MSIMNTKVDANKIRAANGAYYGGGYSYSGYVTLPSPYEDNNYVVVVTLTSGIYNPTIRVVEKNTTNFKIQKDANDSSSYAGNFNYFCYHL